MNGDYKINGKQKEAGGYGASLKEDYRYFYGAHVAWLAAGKPLQEKTVIVK